MLFRSPNHQLSPAMFDSGTNAVIAGGHFTAHEGDHTSVTMNINGVQFLLMLYPDDEL